MPRAGRDLELLVARLERNLAGTSALVKSPDHLPDRVTGELREVDISITTTVGSARIIVIIECRDRKSVQDTTWIEQVISKVQDLRVAKAVAVSSRKFSKPAAKKAAFNGIETRTIQQLDMLEVFAWLQITEFTKVETSFRTRDLTLNIDSPDDPELHPDTIQAFLKERGSAQIFLCPGGHRVNLIAILADVERRDKSIQDKISIDGQWHPQTAKVDFPNKDIQVRTTKGYKIITSLFAAFDLKRTVITEKFHSNRFVYASGDGGVVEGAESEIHPNVILSMHKDVKTGLIYSSLNRKDSLDSE